MKDKNKTQEQLITELIQVRQRIAELEASEHERKQVEEALKKSELQKAAVFDSISEHVVYQDKWMRVLWANRAASESVGVDPQQLVGRHCYEIWQQRRKPCVGCPVVKARKSGQPQEAEMISPDGRVWFIRGYPVQDKKGNVNGTVEVTIEITERKQAEEKLQESEEELEAIFNDARIGIAIFDKTGKILRVNKQILEIGGYAEKEIVGKRFKLLKMFSPRSMATMLANFTKLIAGKNVPPFEVEVYTKKGELLTTELHGSLLRKKGEVAGMVGVMRNITERKQAEKEIERLAFFPKLNPMPIVEVNQKSQLTYANPAGQHLFQDPGKRQDENPFLTGLKPYFTELRKKSKNYVLREVEVGGNWYSQVITLADPEHIRIYSADITERKRMEEELRQSEEKYRELINGMNDTAWVIDFDGNFIDVNDAAVEVLGYSREELLSMGPHDIDTTLDAETITGLIRGMPADKIQVFETTHTTKDGKTIPVEINSSLVTYQGKRAILSIARDITERKRMEQELRESEECFRQFFENEPEYCYMISPEGVIFNVNNAALNALGYKKEELVGKPLKTIYAPESLPKMDQLLEKWKKIGQLADEEVVIITKKGDRRTVLLSAGVVKAADGKVLHSVSVQKDITERKRMEKALRESEEEFRTFMETASDLMHISDKNLNFTFVNEAMARTLGYSKEEMIGMNVAQIMTKEAVQTEFKRNLEFLKKQGEISFETIRVAKDGEEIHGELKLVAIYDTDGTFAGTRGVFRDITERKQMEQELRENEEKLKNIVENSINIFYSHTPDHILTYHSPQVKDILGYEPDEAMVRWTEFASDNPINKEGLKLTVKAIETGKPQPPYEMELVHKNGKKVWVEVREAPVVVNGKTISIVGALTDITERKRVEEELKKSQSLLEASQRLAHIGSWDMDVKTHKVIWSDEVFRIFGLRPQEFQPTFEEFISRIHPDDQDMIPLHYRATLETKKFEEFDYRIKRPNGTVRWLRSTGVVYSDSAGNPIRIVGTLQDITDQKRAAEELKLSYEQLKETLLTTVNALTSMVEMKDRYTAGHQPRVAQLACAIAEEMDLAEEQIEGIRMAGLVHDIGKIMVPAEILSKPGPLTDIQYDMVKMHLQAGYDILKGIKFPWPVAQIVLQHHERMDGSGYPQGLSGEKIMLEARILAVANVVEAMTSHRPYRAAHDIKEALEEISQHQGVFYDPDVVNACLKLFTKKRFTFD